MNKNYSIIWIDDNPERSEAAEDLEKRIKIPIRFISVNKKDTDKVLTELTNSHEEPDLVLMDHSLIATEAVTFKTGSTAALFLHEKWHECPIICITGVDPEEFDLRQKSVYEKIIPNNHISKYDETLISTVEGFRQLKNNRPKNSEHLIKFLTATEEDSQKIKKILPKELKESFSDKSLLLEFYRWINNVLFERPGFLYDRLWTATLLGIKEDNFHIVEAIFKDAEYVGVFANSSNKRWWKSSLLTILGEQVPGFELSWEKGRKLQGIEESHFSKCYASGESFPETVAFEDDSPSAIRVPMKLKYTIPHPHYENLLFFEEIRLMNPE